MKKLNVIFNCILQIFFVIIFLSTLKAKNLDKFNKGNYISDYFSGILLLNENKYNKSYEYLKNLDGLEENHINYSTNYIYSLVNSEKINEAFIYSKKLEKKSLDTFQSDLITGVFYLKRKNFDLAKKYFLKIKNRNSKFLLDDFLTDSLLNWSSLSNLNLASAQNNIEVMSTKFENLKEIQKVFLHCYYQSQKTELLFKKLISNKKVDFSRYNYFYVSYLVGLKNIERAKAIISSSTDLYPNNLLLQQLNIDFEKGKFKSDFNCQNQSHTIAEIFYITANAMSTQRMYRLSNFYLNLAKYLNDDFQTFETLLAENYFNIENFELALKIYGKIEKKGGAYEWYSAKQIAKILIEQKKKKQAVTFLEERYEKFIDRNIYDKFNYAQFLKSNEQFKKSIEIYTEIINSIKKTHELYPEASDARGVAFERIGEWERAEKDFLSSLESNPNQAYVINYLAYSWIEKGIKIKKSLGMLEKANKLKSNDPFIVDSLGWALFKLERYEDSKKYLQMAVQLMPADPVINDHYGDVLWKSGNNIQARYYWNYVLNLEETKPDLKENIKNKLLSGI